MTVPENQRSKKLRLFLCLLACMTACRSPEQREPDPGASAPGPAEARSKPSAAPQRSELVLSPVPTPEPTAVPALENAGEVAEALISAELQIRAESTPPAAFSRLGRVQQAAYRKLVANPEYRSAVLQKAPAALRSTLQANVRAGEQLSSLTKPVTQLPGWRIVQPPPADELRRYYGEAEKEFGIPWEYLAAIHLVESRMGRIRGTSSAGAQGPMQFIPSTWARYGRGDINDPRDAILAAGRYLKAAGAPSDMGRALYAYNHSQKYVDAVTAYAVEMQKNERSYLAYYEWQVYVKTVSGDVLLEVGYGG